MLPRRNRGRNTRRAVTVPGLHIPASMWLTRGASHTFPVLLELEDFFDEELGPHIRLLGFHELGKDPERFEAVIARSTPGPVASLGRGAVTYARTYTGLRFGVRSEEAAGVARAKILAALDRLEAELGSNEYLVGDSFGVADLTAAALFYPMVLPDEGPLPNDEPLPQGLERFRAPLEERPGYRWIEETYRRHRRRARKTATAHA